MFDDDDFRGFIIVLILIGMTLGAALVVGLPWLWSAIKPWLRMLVSG